MPPVKYARNDENYLFDESSDWEDELSYEGVPSEQAVVSMRKYPFTFAMRMDPQAYYDQRPGSRPAARLAHQQRPFPTCSPEGSSVLMPDVHCFRVTMVKGFPIRLDLPLPKSAPGLGDLNPLTGELWTADELAAWPQGYPGLPERTPRTGELLYIPQRAPPVISLLDLVPVPEGGGKQRGPKAKKPSKRKALIERIERGLADRLSDPAPAAPTINIVTRAMAGLPDDYPDWSEQDLQFLWAGNLRAYRWPTTMEEAQQLAAVCESPGNLKAYNMVLVWRHLASEVAPDQRTNEDRIVLEYPWTRPQWLPTTLPEPVVTSTPQSPPSGEPPIDPSSSSHTTSTKKGKGREPGTMTARELKRRQRQMEFIERKKREAEAQQAAGDAATTTGEAPAREEGEIAPPDEMQVDQDDPLLDEAVLVYDGPEPYEMGDYDRETLRVDRILDLVKRSRTRYLPGVELDAEGKPVNEQAFLGFCRLFITGPKNVGWRTLQQYMDVLATIVLADQAPVDLPNLNGHFPNREVDTFAVLDHIGDLWASRVAFDMYPAHEAMIAAIKTWVSELRRLEGAAPSLKVGSLPRGEGVTGAMG